MTTELRSALDNVYAVFARYNAPDYLELGDNFQLRDLTIAQWHQFGEKHDVGVLMFSDNGEMLRYFLPRWLEWLIQDPATRDDLRHWELDDLGRRLTWNHWRNWPADEVAALRELFVVWTRVEIAEYEGAPASFWRRNDDLGDSNDSLGLAGFSVHSDLLHFLAEVGDVAAYMELWLDTNLPQLARWLWTADLHWNNAAREWAISSRLESELEAAFFADADGPNAALFSRSIELVRSLRAQ